MGKDDGRNCPRVDWSRQVKPARLSASFHIVTPRQRTMEAGGARPRIEVIGEMPRVASQAAVRSKL